MKAFPNIELTVSEMGQIRKVYENNLGMDLRDYFAASALQGLLAIERTHYDNQKTIATVAYSYADAMMEARKND